MKRITFITTAQPTTNPRLVKEAEFLKDLGYEVKVIVCFYEKWAEKFDRDIISKNPGMYIFCGGSPFGNIWDKLTYYKTRLRQRLSQEIFKRTKNKTMAETAISRAHPEALNVAKKTNADLFIAHNLGALPTAVKAANKNSAKVGYDAEDMDSGQYVSNANFMYLLNLMIEKMYFQKTDYFSAASPLIASTYKKMYPYLNPVVINNVFPKTPFKAETNDINYALKLFWFSQTVGIHRGIEEVIMAMGEIKKPIVLHLLGDCSEKSKSIFLKIANKVKLGSEQIIFHNPISSKDIFAFAKQFDIGLATEIGIPINRDICLTNKIFTYIQCGLGIIASDTQAQSLFMRDFPECGMVYEKGSVASLIDCINSYIDHPKLLIDTRKRNYKLGQNELNWETESKKFLEIIHQTLSN